MRRLFLILLSLSLIGGAYAQGQKKSFMSTDNYEIEVYGIAPDGFKNLFVWGYGKSVEKAVYNAKKNAVDAALFRTIPGHGDNLQLNTPAICGRKAKMQYSTFFEEFFKPGGEWISYVTLTTDGDPSGQNRLKVHGGYKVGIYVQIDYDALRNRMREEGLASGLNDIF
jgi:hypothetical protein